MRREACPAVVHVAARVGFVLAGDDHGAPGVPTDRGQRLVRPLEDGDGVDRVLGVQLAEQIPRGRDLGLGQVVGQHLLQRRTEGAGHRDDRELHTELVAEGLQAASEPGHGVDQGHVQVEPHGEARWSGRHAPSLGGAFTSATARW